MEEHETEIAYWAGRLIGYDQAWEVAEEIVEAIKKAQSQVIRIHDVVMQSEQLVICKKCGSSEMYQYTKTKDKCEECGNIQDY